MRTGDNISKQIKRAIQLRDKVLLVISETSVCSEWVRWELKNVINMEHDRGKTILFPVRLDNSVWDASDAPEFHELRKKYITDFTDWRDTNRYRQAFSKSVRDLAISASVESERTS